MKREYTPTICHILALAFIMSMTVTVAACGSSDPPTAIDTDGQAPQELAVTVEQQPDVLGQASVYPADLRTGITGLDPVLEALASGDPAEIAARLRLLETACTTADGLGGPPKCDEGVAEGTLVSVFPVLGAEGTFATAEELQLVAESLEFAGLFGVYQITTGPSPEEAYWPTGDYGVILAGSRGTPAYTLLVEGGDIVRIVFHFDKTPEEAFDNGRGVILVPPLQ